MKKSPVMLVLAVLAGTAGAEEYTFDVDEFEKKPFEFTGYVEQKLEWLNLRENSPAYRLAYPGEAGRSDLLRSTSTLELSGKYTLGDFVGDVRTQSSYAADPLVTTTSNAKVMDGGLRWSAGPGLTFDAGKRVLRWGKGYAWNPVGFVERPKDPSDPLASREGFVMASGEWTTSLSGPVSVLTLTALVVPTHNNVNPDFGKAARPNPAARLYLLAWDTDVDFMWRAKGAKPQSWGADFARNITPALELHGEWARTQAAPRSDVSATGSTISTTQDYTSYLIGMRYMTLSEITLTGEYYRNGAGYTANELDDYYTFLDRAFSPAGTAAQMARAQSLAQSGYGKSNPGRDYVYLKASASEPLGWVYGSTALTAIGNVNDGSWQVQPEVSYTGFSNIELRARTIFFGGQPHADFTGKTSRVRAEVYARVFF